MDKITGMVKTCPVCKKDFYLLDVGIWAYKKRNPKGHNRYFCSWSCMRAWEKKKWQLMASTTATAESSTASRQ